MSNVEVHCQYFVKKKKRYCRMTVKKGNKYCGEHQPAPEKSDVNASINRRIPCPLDPTHTCFERKLEKHLKVCNVKRLMDSQPDFIVKGINKDDKKPEVERKAPLRQIDNEILDAVIAKVNEAYGKIPEVPEEVLSHKVLESALNDPAIGKEAKRHLLQNTSLVAHLEKSGLIEDNTCFIEFGAGRGILSYWLAQVAKEKENATILLVDRSTNRNKKDSKLKGEGELAVKRIRADIADLRLCDVDEVKASSNQVGIAKHLCGAATDLTIRCLVQTTQEDRTSGAGLLIAFCCHHRCDYSTYVGHDYLEKCNFAPDDFPILCSIASWATCGSGKNRDLIKNTTDEKTNKRQEREAIGRRVKTLLNWGRLEYLKKFGFDCKLLHYITTDVSLENMCMIAKLPR